RSRCACRGCSRNVAYLLHCPVGATQNTCWSNRTRALRILRRTDPASAGASGRRAPPYAAVAYLGSDTEHSSLPANSLHREYPPSRSAQTIVERGRILGALRPASRLNLFRVRLRQDDGLGMFPCLRQLLDAPTDCVQIGCRLRTSWFT